MEGWRDPLLKIYHFDGFTLDLSRGVLLGPDRGEIPLRPKSFVLLRTLVENAGRLLDHVSLMTAVWPGVVVTDENLAQCIKDVRRALDDEGQRLVKTVVKRGYILTAEVTSGRTREGRFQAISNRESEFVIAVTGSEEGDADANLSQASQDLRGGASNALIQGSGGVNGAPRLSAVVLPFDNLGGGSNVDRLAAAITADLTTDLCRLDGASVVAYRSVVADHPTSFDATLRFCRKVPAIAGFAII